MENRKQAFFRMMRDPGIFRFIYIIDLLLCSVCYVNVVANVAKVVLFPWAAVLLYRNYCANNRIYKVRYWGLLLLFLGVGALTTVLHVADHFFYNVMLLFHVAMCFFLFYGMHAETNKKKIKQEIVRLMKAIVIISTVLSVIGLLIVALFARIYMGDHVLGLMDNRFTGVYINPNPAAFTSVLGMIFCLFLLKKHKKDGNRVMPVWLAVLCMASNSLALLLSDSNGSLVLLLSFVGILVFYGIFQITKHHQLTKRAVAKRCISFVALCLVISLGVFGVRSLSQFGVGMMVSGREQLVIGDTINPTAQPDENGNPPAKPVSSSVGQVEIGREENEDISSGRFDSLGKALQLFLKSPIIGIGQANIVEYGERYLEEGFLFDDLHNGYLTVLVSYGIIGFLLLMAFLLVLARRMYAAMRKNLHKGRKELPLLFAMLGAYCVYSLFDITLLLDVNFMVLIFWLLMGYATTYLVQYETQFEVITAERPLSVLGLRNQMRVPMYLLPTGRTYSSLCLISDGKNRRDA